MGEPVTARSGLASKVWDLKVDSWTSVDFSGFTGAFVVNKDLDVTPGNPTSIATRLVPTAFECDFVGIAFV